MQNDFCSKGGLFDCAGINISAVQKAVEPTRKVLSAAREAGVKIVYLKMGFPADLSDLGDTGSVSRNVTSALASGDRASLRMVGTDDS